MRGRTVLPGLIDTHVHALGVAEAEATQPFRNLTSIGEVQAWIRDRGRTPSAGHVDLDAARVSRRGCASTGFPRARSSMRPRRDIRSRSMARMRSSLNTAALRAAGITRDTPDPAGRRDRQGRRRRADGAAAQRRVACSRASNRPRRQASPLDMLERVHQQYSGRRHHERDRTRARRVEGYEAYKALNAPGACTCRATVTIRIPHADDAGAGRARSSTACRSGSASGDEWLKVGPLKIVADGGILIGTSFMRSRTDPARAGCMASTTRTYRGFLTLTPEQIARAIAIGHRHGWQMVAHVTGDAGVDLVLDAIEAAERE